MSNVSVLGLGYIGLPTAAILAVRGHQVHGVDVSEHVVQTLSDGAIHIVEPGLDIVVSGAIKSGALTVSLDVAPADVFILAVPTPFLEDHKPDLSFVRSAAESIAPHIAKGNLVILESTSPVGATKQLSQWLGDLRPDLKFPHEFAEHCDVNVAHCPERVLPGKVLEELVENDRVVGGISESCTQAAISLYKTFVDGKCLATTAATAEMAKLTENAFRDVNIAFANELSILAEEQSVDVWELIELANHHPRVNVLQPGPGVGGHCIAVDPWFLVSGSPENARLIRQARHVNDQKPDYVIAKVEAALSSAPRPVVACLGLSFKANIDDLRESPAVDICMRLAKLSGVSVKAVEPHIEQLPATLSDHGNIELCDVAQAVAEADVVLLLVDHNQFADVPTSFDLSAKHIIDTRGLWRQRR
ncbi:Ndp-n-acetyl-d-galactosaminuronic acid dehydrogenase oxidoreductase protein [gamma proteobacterium NOR5-3]|nr:Ndp-n-acetyl-d-galactosaminuronic acid dehydrogenase oxidoreductase protein [gamma proteobacterium NOR5-3]